MPSREDILKGLGAAAALYALSRFSGASRTEASLGAVDDILDQVPASSPMAQLLRARTRQALARAQAQQAPGYRSPPWLAQQQLRRPVRRLDDVCRVQPLIPGNVRDAEFEILEDDQ